MSTTEIISLIWDIFIIVASRVVIVAILGVGMSCGGYNPTIRRTMQYVEQSSSILQNIVSQPVNLIGAVGEFSNCGLGIQEAIRKRERKNENDED